MSLQMSVSAVNSPRYTHIPLGRICETTDWSGDKNGYAKRYKESEASLWKALEVPLKILAFLVS